MRVLILNGEPNSGTEFDGYVASMGRELEAAGHAVERLDLRDQDLKGCSGCFGCWVKTPGTCVKKDGSETVCRAVLDSDLLLLASPLVMGFTTALLKRAADQMIPLVHPYFAIEGGEMHHRARYARYPQFGLLISPEADTDAEDIAITQLLWSRMARNMKSQLVFTAVANRPAEEVAHELTAAA